MFEHRSARGGRADDPNNTSLVNKHRSIAELLVALHSRVCVCVPLQVLSGGDGKGASAPARPQQQVPFVSLLLQQQLSLVTRHAVVTAAVGQKNNKKQVVILLKRFKAAVQRLKVKFSLLLLLFLKYCIDVCNEKVK